MKIPGVKRAGSTREQAEAIYEAVCDGLSALGPFPYFREDVIQECGKAFERFLENHCVAEEPEDEGNNMTDITRATEATQEVMDGVRDMFEYHPWDDDQREKGKLVRDALMEAVNVIIEAVPPSPDRSAAIRKLREARMDCNSAITHNGRY